MFGTGLIDEIPSEVLVAVAARQPAAVRGRVNRTKEGRIGRFGSEGGKFRPCTSSSAGPAPMSWASRSPVIRRVHRPWIRTAMPKGLDLTEPECDDLVAYVRALPAPAVIDPSGLLGTKDMHVGRRLFARSTARPATFRPLAASKGFLATCCCTTWAKA